MALAISVVGFALFIRWEKHRERGHRSALLHLGLFSYSTFSWGNFIAGAVAIGEFAIIFMLPLYLINTLDLSTMSAGLVLAAMAVGAFSPARQPPRRGTVRGRLAPCSSGSDWKPSASLSSSCLWGRIRMVGSSLRR